MENIKFIQTTDPTVIEQLRLDYLNHLPLSQEYYLEILIKDSNLYIIFIDNTQAGYFVLSPDNVLLEYYIFPEWINQMDEIFGFILKEVGIKKALCKTFDSDLLFCCLAFHKKTSTIGFMFRDFKAKSSNVTPSGINVRRAEMNDEDQIIAVNEEVFDHDEEVGQYIRAQQIFLFEKANSLVGFGIFSPVFQGRKEYDIGMLITPPFRHQGYGTFIINYLVNYCRQNGWIPNAGCAVENIASRKCLEKAGFVTHHRLLEFLF
ncbi:hypothetical protein hrd7_30660 [Leptolinea sp. HRD-7]|nr:hypothetical protein hrd7_30660 [Leptolinea sp. HRD-7]